MWKETKSLALQKQRQGEEAKNLLRMMRNDKKDSQRKDSLSDSELMAYFWKKKLVEIPNFGENRNICKNFNFFFISIYI